MTKENTTSKKPCLRFPEFSGEWEEKRLGEVAKVLQGFGFPEKYQGKKNGDLPFCKVSDISIACDKGKNTITQAANFVDFSLLPILHAKTLPLGATIFAKIGEAIRSNNRIKIGVQCLIDNNVAAVKAGDLCTDDFLFYAMTRINLMDYAGGVVPSVSKSCIEAIPISLPSLAEQRKIASCLSEMDNLIVAQEQKVEALRERKKGLMQQLFPQNGQTVPRLRFPEFSGEWEEKRLGEIGITYNGLSGKSKDDFENGNSKFITFMNVLNNVRINTEILSIVNVNDNERQNRVEFGDMLFNTSSETPEEVGFCAVYDSKSFEPVYLNSFCFGYRFNDMSLYLPIFLAYYFRSEQGRNIMHRLAQGITRFNLSKEYFKKAEISFPSLAEQQKIASCLSELDNLIAAQAKKTETLKIYKKALLQGMFVGKDGEEVKL